MLQCLKGVKEWNGEVASLKADYVYVLAGQRKKERIQDATWTIVYESGTKGRPRCV